MLTVVVALVITEGIFSKMQAAFDKYEISCVRIGVNNTSVDIGCR